MTRAALHLVSAACAFALACGHEASAPSPLRDAPETIGIGAVPPDPEEPVPSAPLALPVARPGGAPAPACIDVESSGEHVTLEGHVFVDDLHEHPTRGKTHPYILRLDEPRCTVGTDTPSIRELHLASIDGLPLKPLAGKHVRVSGDPFSAHTAWHARPVVLMTTKATLLP
jgi:hypothetical protein